MEGRNENHSCSSTREKPDWIRCNALHLLIRIDSPFCLPLIARSKCVLHSHIGIGLNIWAMHLRDVPQYVWALICNSNLTGKGKIIFLPFEELVFQYFQKILWFILDRIGLNVFTNPSSVFVSVQHRFLWRRSEFAESIHSLQIYFKDLKGHLTTGIEIHTRGYIHSSSLDKRLSLIKYNLQAKQKKNI